MDMNCAEIFASAEFIHRISNVLWIGSEKQQSDSTWMNGLGYILCENSRPLFVCV